MLIKLYMDKKKECAKTRQRFNTLMCQYERIIYRNKWGTNMCIVIIKIYEYSNRRYDRVMNIIVTIMEV